MGLAVLIPDRVSEQLDISLTTLRILSPQTLGLLGLNCLIEP